MKEKAKALVAKMTLEEKASLCSGKDFWHTKEIDRLGIPSIMLTDGPHGLRRQPGAADHLGISESVPATCFPAACATSCSFDVKLMEEIGKAMGEECLQEDVGVILGPGVNIKRSPLCGRNFEYISEDPVLSGELAAGLINGVQSKGIGTSIKHYAANNQEARRMTISSVVDDRALFEVYLKPFEIAIRKAQPWTIMTAYNKINGVYASDSKRLINDCLREAWGFLGIAVTDWGGMNDRIVSVKAGNDLQMPADGGVNDQKIIDAVRAGELNETKVDELAVRLVEMALKAQAAGKPGYKYDVAAHHTLARKAAANSCVLLKNSDNLLPLAKSAKLAVIGEFAKKPRYQGAGSSKINPTTTDNAYEELEKYGYTLSYAQGYAGLAPNESLIAEAASNAKQADIALVFAGLPDEYESEGFDRQTLAMPASHTELISKVASANPNTIVVLQVGSPVLTDFSKDIKGLLVAYLGGQASGGGVADLLSGQTSPSGKLAETWPLALEDTPSYKYFPGETKTVEYRESIYVGYRYYEKANVPVAYAFGEGLSYTQFKYSDLKASADNVEFTLENTGNIAAAEIAQVYLGLSGSEVFRPKKWLASFDKYFLEPDEKKTVKISIPKTAYEYYNTAVGGFRTEGGEYDIFIAAASSDLRLKAKVKVAGDGDESKLASQKSLGYFNISSNEFSTEDFEAIYGEKLPPANRLPDAPYTVNDTLQDVKDTQFGQILMQMVKKDAEAAFADMPEDARLMVEGMLADMPIRGIAMMSQGKLPGNFAEMFVDALNGKVAPELMALAQA